MMLLSLRRGICASLARTKSGRVARPYMSIISLTASPLLFWIVQLMAVTVTILRITVSPSICTLSCVSCPLPFTPHSLRRKLYASVPMIPAVDTANGTSLLLGFLCLVVSKIALYALLLMSAPLLTAPNPKSSLVLLRLLLAPFVLLTACWWHCAMDSTVVTSSR